MSWCGSGCSWTGIPGAEGGRCPLIALSLIFQNSWSDFWMGSRSLSVLACSTLGFRFSQWAIASCCFFLDRFLQTSTHMYSGLVVCFFNFGRSAVLYDPALLWFGHSCVERSFANPGSFYLVSSWISDPTINQLGVALDIRVCEPENVQVSYRNRRRTPVWIKKVISRSGVHAHNSVTVNHPEIFGVFLFVQEVFSSLFALTSSSDSDSSAAGGFPRLPDSSSSEESEEEDYSLSLALVSLGMRVGSPYFSSIDLTGKKKTLC